MCKIEAPKGAELGAAEGIGGTRQFVQRNCELTDLKTHTGYVQNEPAAFPNAWGRLLQTSIFRAAKPNL